MLSRKEFIRRIALGSAVAPLLLQQLGCSSEGNNSTTGTASGDSTRTAGRSGPPPDGSTCASTPELTGGPYPYDLSGKGAMMRRAIHENKPGLPFRFTFMVVNTKQGCTAIEGARIDVWHCDANGYYSEYEEPGYLGTRNFTNQTFCRGIQRTDAHGQVTFESIYPGWYEGRITYVHFEVYIGRKKVLTSQLAFPDSINAAVYAKALYNQHGNNTSVKRNAIDMVFSETPTTLAQALFHVVPNAASGGYTGSYTIGVPV